MFRISIGREMLVYFSFKKKKSVLEGFSPRPKKEEEVGDLKPRYGQGAA